MLLLRNSMHAISPMRTAVIFHRHVHDANYRMRGSRIEYLHVYRIHQEMHTYLRVYVQLENSTTLS